MFAGHTQITRKRLGKDVFAVVLVGEVDLYKAPELSVELGRVIDAGAREVVIDLIDTTFVDSTALGVLLEARNELVSRGGRLVLANENQTVRRALEVTRLEEIFDSAPSERRDVSPPLSARRPARS